MIKSTQELKKEVEKLKGSLMIKSIQVLHESAMDKAYMAVMKKGQGDTDASEILFEEAFNLEKHAAIRAKKEKIGEPSESIFLKSAACLAIDCRKYQEAQLLVLLALSGNITERTIKEELDELLETIESFL